MDIWTNVLQRLAALEAAEKRQTERELAVYRCIVDLYRKGNDMSALMEEFKALFQAAVDRLAAAGDVAAIAAERDQAKAEAAALSQANTNIQTDYLAVVAERDGANALLQAAVDKLKEMGVEPPAPPVA